SILASDSTVSLPGSAFFASSARALPKAARATDRVRKPAAMRCHMFFAPHSVDRVDSAGEPLASPFALRYEGAGRSLQRRQRKPERLRGGQHREQRPVMWRSMSRAGIMPRGGPARTPGGGGWPAAAIFV